MFNRDNNRKSGMGIRTALQTLAVAMVLLFATTNAKADFLNLQSPGASGFINGAFYQQGPTLSGTGIFPAFVQVAGGGSPDVHAAYNTNGDLNTAPLLNGSSDVFNHPITVGDAAVTVNGQNYLRFFLDINESDTASDRYLAMTELRIFTGGAPNQTTLDVTDPTTLGTLRYDMGAGNGVLLDYDIGEGSGKADMVLLIPLYAGAVLTDNLYLYSSFGRATTGITCTGSGGVSGGAAGCVVAGGNYFNSDGFEEWAVLQGEVSIVPEPSTYALYALGATMLFVSGWWQRRRRALLSPMA